jgi:transposase
VSSLDPEGSTGGKKTTGIKRHVCVDTLGLIWGLAITTADVADCKGARLAVTLAKAASERLVHVWADSAYQGFIEFAWVLLDLVVAIVSRRKGAVGFEVQPRRWVVERTFGWLTRWRRLNRNYEHTPESSKAVVQVAMIGIMARRLAKTHK